MSIVILLSITKPQHNLFSWQMGLGTLIGTIALIMAFYLFDKLEIVKIENVKWLYPALLIGLGIFLYGISCIGRNSPESLVDYGRVWNAALEIASGKELSEEWYFKIYANNIKPMLFLSVLIKIATALRFKDPYYFILIFSVLEVIGAAWGIGILSGNTLEERKRYRIPIILMFFFLLPIWANTQGFYTDTMSFGTVAISFAIMKLAFDEKQKGKKYLLIASASVILAIGVNIKITVLIPIIAAGIITLLFRRDKKHMVCVSLLLLFTIVVNGMILMWAQTYEIWNSAKVTSEPIIDWVALGMKGEGNYYDNRDYAAYVTNLPTRKEKIEYSKQYIWENRRCFFDKVHLIQKIRCNFASGNLGTKDFTYYALQEHNIIWELFAPWGKHYWRTSQFCFCYIFSFYTVYFLGGILTVVSILKTKKISLEKMMCDLTLFGNFVFLMIWEANNRQLYNQMPIFILGVIMNVRMIIQLKKENERK